MIEKSKVSFLITKHRSLSSASFSRFIPKIDFSAETSAKIANYIGNNLDIKPKFHNIDSSEQKMIISESACVFLEHL